MRLILRASSVLGSDFNNVAGPQVCNFIKKRLQHRLGKWMSINLQSHSVDRNSMKNHTQCLKNQENIRPKKKLSCFRKSAGWNFFYHLPVRLVAFVSEYIFFVSNKKTHTERNKKQKKLKKIEKQKKLKKIEKQKKLKKKRRKKMLLLLLTISVENLMGHDDIVWQFALSTFNLRDQPTKRERQLKNNKLWKESVYIHLLFV